MKKIWMMLPIAAMMMTACSNEDELAPEQPKTKQVEVTLSANYDNMRAAFDPSTKKMTFKAGDVLHIEGDYDGDSSNDIVGNLTLTAGAGTNAATFTGTLTVPSAYTGDDILNEDITFLIYLFPSTWETDGYYTVNGDGYINGVNPYDKIRPTLQEVVEKYGNIYWYGEKPRVNFSNFSLTNVSCAFFNCVISGLDPNTEYYVEMGSVLSVDEVPFTDGTITSDADGKATFAAVSDILTRKSIYISFKIWYDYPTDDYLEIHRVNLGDKTLEAGKIYKITKNCDY